MSGAWAEAKAGDGRTYYWNKSTKETSWTKPADFNSPGAPVPTAPAAPTGPTGDWSEAKAPDGRTYYFNKATRETSWQRPVAMGPPSQPRQHNARPDFVAGVGGQDLGRSGYDDRLSRRDGRDPGLPQKPAFDGPRGGGMPWEGRQDTMGFRGPMPAKPDEPEYASTEQAEEAFFKLLKRHNISPDTDWKDAMMAVIRDREFRAIKDPKERKQAFDSYCIHAREQEKEREKERQEKLREDFRRMLTTHDDIKYYTRWKTARPLIELEAVYKSAGDEDESRRMFDEYKAELNNKHVVDSNERHKFAMRELNSMLKALILDQNTRWADIEEKIFTNERFLSDSVFRELHKGHIAQAIDKHMRALGVIAAEASKKDKQMRKRRERQARDGFKQLLAEKLEEGKIKAGSQWQHLRPLIADDERYTAYLGMPGSDPLDLFRDILEDEERKLRPKRNDVLDLMDEIHWKLKLDTTVQEFMDVVRREPRTSYIKDDELAIIYERLIEKAKRHEQAKEITAEQHKREILDGIRYAMKRLEPHIRIDDSYEDISQRLASNRDFQDAEDDVRRTAFEKYMRRLKDKDEHDRERSRRDRDRNRERELRNASRRSDRDRDRDRRHRTRTPEIDAYEADRRKAQEVRERQHRKPSFGLTPPPRDRREDRYDRERRYDRNESMSVYDRERREREMERERNYISRADPRDKGKTLDYGDEETVGSRPGSVRKRRDSEGSINSRREHKRSRRDRRTRSPEPEGVLKEEPPALQSGSEEGEIEEI